MRSARWLPRERAEESNLQQPWLEAPSPFDYRPIERPAAETQNLEDDEVEERRVIIIDI